MTKSVHAVVLSCLGAIAITGCATQVESAESTPADAGVAAAEAAAPDGGATSTSTAALTSGGGGAVGFSCGPLGCICNGDYDCNNMFGSGVCNGLPAKCWERGPGPVYCICGGPFPGRVTAAGTTVSGTAATTATVAQ